MARSCPSKVGEAPCVKGGGVGTEEGNENCPEACDGWCIDNPGGDTDRGCYDDEKGYGRVSKSGRYG